MFFDHHFLLYIYVLLCIVLLYNPWSYFNKVFLTIAIHSYFCFQWYFSYSTGIYWVPPMGWSITVVFFLIRPLHSQYKARWAVELQEILAKLWIEVDWWNGAMKLVMQNRKYCLPNNLMLFLVLNMTIWHFCNIYISRAHIKLFCENIIQRELKNNYFSFLPQCF